MIKNKKEQGELVTNMFQKQNLFRKENNLIRRMLTTKKFEQNFQAKEKYGNSKRMKSTIMMRDTMIICMISIMKMATTTIMDMMTIIMKMNTIMNLTITKQKFIILTEIIIQKNTREVQAEATHLDQTFLDFKIIMGVINNLDGLTTRIKQVQSLMIEIIIKRILIIRVYFGRIMELKNLRKEQ